MIAMEELSDTTRRRATPLKDASGPNGGELNGASSSKASKSEKFDDGYDFLLVNEDIRESTFPEVMGCVNRHKKNDNVVLILVTYGGSANAAYRTARLLQTVYEDVVAFLPAECKSAGTLLVTAANSVVISPFGEIGPLDVQLLKRDELSGRRSGLTTRSALEDLKTHSFDLFEHFMTEIISKSGTAVSFRTAADVAARVSSKLMSRIYEQINPDALGQDYRDLSIAIRYGERLNRKFNNLQKDALKRLVYDYPSHDFVIDLEEARELFQRVELPTPALMRLVSSRAMDCLIPKYGSDRLVAMLDGSGKNIVIDKKQANVAQRNSADASDSPKSDGGDAAGARTTP
ncbi:hypothetical protein DYI24_06870 [Rhodopseudomonas sp. BR0C11]|nr:hypothetical protein [Rhodopseudomonas sp. BR0C11]